LPISYELGHTIQQLLACYGDDGTASKKLITDTRDSELKLFVHTVMSSEDLLIKILLRLPVISLLLFKVISKHWLSVITSPNFTSRLSRIPSMAPACGLFLWRRKSKVSMEFEYDFLSLDSRIPSKRSITTFPFGFETGCKVILGSCYGLLLFRSGYYPGKLYVYNPTINLFKMLPRHSTDISYGVIMAFDPTKC
ncbi:SGNH hydrolase-type esterase domain-containing protein, partial [Tanacetum coccineum]